MRLAEKLLLPSLPKPSRLVVLDPAAAPPLSVGKREAATAVRRARDSRTLEEAEARSGLFARAMEIMRVKVGSLKRLHQRVRSRLGSATGKPWAFFQSAGTETGRLLPMESTAQPLKPRKAKLENRKNLRNAGSLSDLKNLLKSACGGRSIPQHSVLQSIFIRF